MAGGPLFMLLHLLFAVSSVAALVAILRRVPWPWTLTLSAVPFICASAAAHISFVGKLMILDASVPPEILIAPFIYAMRLFNWGCVVSLVLVVLAFFSRPKNERANNTNA